MQFGGSFTQISQIPQISPKFEQQKNWQKLSPGSVINFTEACFIFHKTLFNISRPISQNYIIKLFHSNISRNT